MAPYFALMTLWPHTLVSGAQALYLGPRPYILLAPPSLSVGQLRPPLQPFSPFHKPAGLTPSSDVKAGALLQPCFQQLLFLWLLALDCLTCLGPGLKWFKPSLLLVRCLLHWTLPHLPHLLNQPFPLRDRCAKRPFIQKRNIKHFKNMISYLTSVK